MEEEKEVRAARESRRRKEALLKKRTQGWIRNTEKQLHQERDELSFVASLLPGKAPLELLCPMTKVLMVDPVMAMDGHTYERERIEEWFRTCPAEKKPTSPATGETLSLTDVIPNVMAKSMCDSHQRESKVASLLMKETTLEGY